MADLSGRIELPLALAALCSEMEHEVLIRIAENIVAARAVLFEVERRALENRDQVGQTFNLLLAVAELCRVIEIWEIRLRKLLVGRGKLGPRSSC